MYVLFYQYSQLVPHLQREWPDIKYGNDKKIWEKEWEKHGTCSLNSFTQAGYFQLALHIKVKNDLVDVLKKSRIVPHKTASHDIAELLQLLKVIMTTRSRGLCALLPRGTHCHT